MRNPKLIAKFSAALSAPARRLLDELLRIAEPQDVPLYLVGGPLRDLLLDRPSLDIDIAVEGDAIALARDLADASRRDAPKARLGAATTPEPRVVTHPTFLTASVRIPGLAPLPGYHLDLITARSETYARPGALPTVRPATIREDLLRRDFTINAVALRLTGTDAGAILDATSGLRDLDAKLIRALHERSFQDDATRILRAFRYATRLGFEIESETRTWLKRDIRYLETISATRLHHEFARIFSEPSPEVVMRSLHDVGSLAAIHPALRFERSHAEAFTRLRADGRPSGRELHPTGARAAYWPVLAWAMSEAEAAGIAGRLALTRSQRAAVEAMPALAALIPRRDAPKARLGGMGGATLRDPHLKRSAIAEVLSPFPLPTVWAFVALTDDSTVRGRFLDYLTKARHERPHLTGDDLLALGVPPGPPLGDLLRRLRIAKLDGEVRSKSDEIRLVEDVARRGGFQTRPSQRPDGVATSSRSS